MSSSTGSITSTVGRISAAVLAVAALAAGAFVIPTVTGNGGQSCPAYPSFPDASCTGVPAGVTLTAYTGPNPVTTNNTVIDSKLITTTLNVQASGVVIKNSHITSNLDAGDLWALGCQDQDACGQGATPLTVQDSEIDCAANGTLVAGGGTAVQDSNITLRRVDIHGCENGMSVDQKIDIQDSYIHDLLEDPNPVKYPPDGTHTDGIQFSDCHYTGAGGGCGGGYQPGALDITIKHNRIEGWGTLSDGTSGHASTSAIITNRGPTNIDNNILIDRNLFVAGHDTTGGSTVYCEQDGFSATNERITNNHFSTALSGEYSTTDCANESDTSGNVDHETGDPLTLDVDTV